MLVLCLGVLFCQCFCLVEDSSALCGVVGVCVCVSARQRGSKSSEHTV